MSDTPSVADGESCCPSMSSKARNIGFIVCLLAGSVISFIEVHHIMNPTKTFAMWILIGDALILGSSLFMSSLKTQWQKMMAPLRATTTIVLLASIACTVVFALFGWGELTTIAAIVQYCSLLWYVLSLIPGGQKCCTACINTCCGACCGCVKGATA